MVGHIGFILRQACQGSGKGKTKQMTKTFNITGWAPQPEVIRQAVASTLGPVPPLEPPPVMLPTPKAAAGI